MFHSTTHGLQAIFVCYGFCVYIFSTFAKLVLKVSISYTLMFFDFL